MEIDTIETISDGIKSLKEKRNELKRLIELQNSKFSILIPISANTIDEAFDTDPNIVKFDDLEVEIQALKTEIMNLRWNLDHAGHETFVVAFSAGNENA